jgi:hypothetical protein
MSPRLTDWSLAVAACVAFVSGLVGLISGHAGQWLVFALHGVAGFWLLALLWGKLRRVWPRVMRPRCWDRRTLFGLLALAVVALAIGSGIVWVVGGDVSLVGFNLLNWHILLGFVLALAIAAHMLARAKRLRARDIRGRRQMIQFGALLVGSIALWPVQQGIEHILNLPGAKERFTGSREAGSYASNAFPTTSWVADSPQPVDLASWRLQVSGAVASPALLTYSDLAEASDAIDAILDCTGGFYSAQIWRGMRVGRLLDSAGPLPDARFVSFVSVTGYRWSLPISEARNALLVSTTMRL